MIDLKDYQYHKPSKIEKSQAIKLYSYFIIKNIRILSIDNKWATVLDVLTLKELCIGIRIRGRLLVSQKFPNQNLILLI